jgi:hypothetical protein
MAERAVFAGIVVAAPALAVAAWVDYPSGVPCGETIPMEQRRPGDATANNDDMLARFENWTLRTASRTRPPRKSVFDSTSTPPTSDTSSVQMPALRRPVSPTL